MRWSLVLAALVLLTPGLAVNTARAQPSRAETAKAAKAAAAKAAAMYREAVALMDKGKYAIACPKLEEVVRLVPEGIGAKITLAECFEESGRLASAWAAFGVAEQAAGAAGQRGRQMRARARRDALEPKVAKLTIQVGERARSLEGLSILRDGAPVAPDAWGTAVPVDKGRHAVVATAGAYRFEKEVEVAADGASVSVLIEGPAPAPPPSDPDPGVLGGLGAQRTAGLIAAGAGVVGIGLGSFFGVRAISKKNESNESGHCREGNKCDLEGIALRDEGLTAATISTVLFIAGGAAAAGGVVLFLTAPKADPGAGANKANPKTAAKWLGSAQVAIGPGGIAVRGSW
jgi:hypothetical protein